MGAGAVKEAASASDNKGVPQQSEVMSSCESCSTNFTLLKRKKLCTDCGKLHCSNCMSKQTVGKVVQRRCKQCQLLTSGNFTRSQLMAMPTKDLKSFIIRRKIPMNNCREKADLVDVLFSTSNNSYYKAEQAEKQRHLVELEERKRHREAESGHWNSARSSSQNDSSDNQQSSNQSTSTFHPEESNTENPASHSEQQQASTSVSNQAEQESNRTSENNLNNHPPDDMCGHSNAPTHRRKLTHLNDLKNIKDIEALSIRQLKEVLATNYVIYKGCCEKWELVERVERLWIEQQKNLDRVNELEKTCEASSANNESEMCKICMDAVIDCVLLDCGHMVACTQCGRQMAECPMCRQYVVRVVHVFKA